MWHQMMGNRRCFEHSESSAFCCHGLELQCRGPIIQSSEFLSFPQSFIKHAGFSMSAQPRNMSQSRGPAFGGGGANDRRFVGRRFWWGVRSAENEKDVGPSYAKVRSKNTVNSLLITTPCRLYVWVEILRTSGGGGRLYIWSQKSRKLNYLWGLHFCYCASRQRYRNIRNFFLWFDFDLSKVFAIFFPRRKNTNDLMLIFTSIVFVSPTRGRRREIFIFGRNFKDHRGGGFYILEGAYIWWEALYLREEFSWAIFRRIKFGCGRLG